jgi:hypothetical protein
MIVAGMNNMYGGGMYGQSMKNYITIIEGGHVSWVLRNRYEIWSVEKDGDRRNHTSPYAYKNTEW